jgi:hypothetical protein
MAFGIKKVQVPEFLRPEMPGLSTLKRMSKHEPVVVLRISDHGRAFNLCEMMRLDNWIFDDMKGIRYMVQHESVNLRVNLTSGKPAFFHAYICDDETASTVQLSNILKETKDVWIDGLTIDGIKIHDVAKDVQVPKEIQAYTVMGSTVQLISSMATRKWFNPGPSNWSNFFDNKAVSDLFPRGMPWGWVAVGIAAGFFIGFASGGVLFILIGHSI